MNQSFVGTVSKGFTVVELAVTIVVIGILVGPLVATITDFYLDTIRSNTQATMQTSLRAAMRSMSEDMKLSAGAQNSNLLTDSYAPAGGWVTSSAQSELVLKTPATNSADAFIMISGDEPYYNEYIYYVENQALYKRVLSHAGASDNTAVTTCPPNMIIAGCPADAQLVDDVAAMSFVFGDETGAVTADPTAAQSITLSVRVEHQYGDHPIEVEETTTAAFRNK